MALLTDKQKFLVRCLLVISLGSTLRAQDVPNAPDATERSPVPVITGFLSYHSNFGQGTLDIAPEFDPVLLLPIGNKVLLQAEFDMALDEQRTAGSWGPAVIAHGFDYLQADVFAHPHLTVVGGYYLIPFGIYRERMHPLWIRYLQAEPISFTLNATSGSGGMLRGGARLTSKADVTYAAYYSAASTNTLLSSDKQVGYRGALVLLNRHIELGTSYNHTAGVAAHNMVGTDLTWTARRIPLEIRSETLFSHEAGNTYWVEGAYRLSKLGSSPLLRYSSIVFRKEQYWLPGNPAALSMMGGAMGSLPTKNTRRSTVGAVFSLTPDLRFDAAYQGNYATGQNSHNWNIGFTYRSAIR